MIWCVEDDDSVREIEIYTLKSTGFDAEGFTCGDELFRALKQRIPRLIILDVMLPGKDGVEILKELKNSFLTRDIPVIMATAKGMEYDKIQSLDLGADDYLVKPFGMMEMVSRVKAVLRRSEQPKSEDYVCIGGLSLNQDAHIVTVDGERIQLTLKEYQLLALFMTHPGMVFTRDQLLNDVWDSEYSGETRTVDMHIRTLRQKISPYHKLIETVRGVGYRMEAASDDKKDI